MGVLDKGDLNLHNLSESFAEANKSSDSYIGSLAYYLLTGRKGSHLYEGDAGRLVVSAHPHTDDRLMIFPEIGGDGSLTAKLLQNIDAPRNGIQLARYGEADLAKLQTALDAQQGPGHVEIAEIPEDIMDWKYPVRILDTAKTGGMKGAGFDKLRNKFNKAAAHLTTIPLLSDNAIPAMRASLMFWAGTMIYAGKETGHDMTGFYGTLFSVIKACPTMFDGFVVMNGEEPAGFTVWDKPVNGTANALAGLSRKSIKGMSEFQTVTACRMLSEQGVTRYNMGGSETAGLDRHKVEYQPTESLDVRSYDVAVKKLADFGVRALPVFPAHSA